MSVQSLLLTLILLAVAPTAGAQTTRASAAPAPAPLVLAPPGPPPAPPARTKEEWYGWKLLIVDGAVITSGVGLAVADAPAAGAITAVSGYVLGGPIVHWAHGQVGRGFVSLGGRIVIPLLTGATVLGVTYAAFGTGNFVGSRRSDNVFDSVNMVFALGAAALSAPVAIALDAGILARRPARTPTAKQASLQWAPSAGYDPKSQRLQLNVGGSF